MARIQKKRRSLAARCIIFMWVLILLVVVVLGGVILGYGFFGNPNSTNLAASIARTFGVEGGQLMFAGLPDRLNVLILGVDGSGNNIGRSDSIMLFSMDTQGGDIDIIAIPRDSQITLSQERLEILRQNGRNTARSSGVMRLNELTHHAGPNFALEFSKLQVQELFGIEIHYAVLLELGGFVSIVDTIGGVEFDVPQRMFYTDPHQNLVIDLQPGLQVLDGNMAEGLVRYRSGFADADLGRIRTQQAFMVAALGQILSLDNFMSNPSAYFDIFFNYIQTDMSMLNIARYMLLLNRIDLNKIQTNTVAGVGGLQNGRFYIIIDEAELEALVNDVFN